MDLFYRMVKVRHGNWYSLLVHILHSKVAVFTNTKPNIINTNPGAFNLRFNCERVAFQIYPVAEHPLLYMTAEHTQLVFTACFVVINIVLVSGNVFTRTKLVDGVLPVTCFIMNLATTFGCREHSAVLPSFQCKGYG